MRSRSRFGIRENPAAVTFAGAEGGGRAHGELERERERGAANEDYCGKYYTQFRGGSQIFGSQLITAILNRVFMKISGCKWLGGLLKK